MSHHRNYNIVGNGKKSENRFLVQAGVKATVVLNNVYIKTKGYSPFEMSGAEVDLYLRGTNTLICESGAHGAGLQTSENSVLTINSADPTANNNSNTSGKLIAIGNEHGAGIGGACSTGNPSSASATAIGARNNAGTITIKGGTIEATGGYYAAGIGGGSSGGSIPGAYKAITIEGGNVTATGGAYGSGIGAAGTTGSTKYSTTEKIVINGGTINAKGGKDYTASSDQGAGIGSGRNFDSGPIEISSNAKVSATGYNTGYTDANSNPQSIGAGDGGTSGSITQTNNQPSAINTPPTFPPVTVPVAVKVPQTNITEVSETTSSNDSSLNKVSKFYNEDGVFLLQQPQTLKITQGNGKTASVTLYELDTMDDVAKKN